MSLETSCRKLPLASAPLRLDKHCRRYDKQRDARLHQEACEIARGAMDEPRRRETADVCGRNNCGARCHPHHTDPTVEVAHDEPVAAGVPTICLESGPAPAPIKRFWRAPPP